MLSAILGDDVDIQLGGETVTLKPTLRAGIEALRLCGTFSVLLRAVNELDSRSVERLIEIGSGRSDVRDLIDRSTWASVAMLTGALGHYVIILANGGTIPIEEDDPGEKPSASEDQHDAFFARLFKIGVGWLGWTPDQTLDATMPAIVSAYAGRQDMLAAIFGGGGATTRNDIPLDQKVRAIFDHMGTTKVSA